jgi:CheY-like chemotaxis protein
MPDMDGEAVGRAIRQDPNLKSTALILLTSGSQRGEAGRFIDQGFAGFLLKPVVKPSLLLEAIARAWDRPLPTPPATPLPEPTPALQPASAEQRHRVLLAEDNAVNALLATRMLEKLECRVDRAADGDEACRMAARFPYSLIFMDCQMPQLDGYEATARIRAQDGPHRRVPIVALTAEAMQGDRERCLDAGMDDYLSKPIHPEQLAEVVRKWLPARV